MHFLFKSIKRTVALETHGLGLNRAGLRLRLKVEQANDSMKQAIKFNRYKSQFGEEE